MSPNIMSKGEKMRRKRRRRKNSKKGEKGVSIVGVQKKIERG